MPTKILTDQPQSKGKSYRASSIPATAFTLIEAPYFSRTGRANDALPVDPSDNNRTLLPGEVFLRTPLHITNVAGSGTVTVTVTIAHEDGGTTTLAQDQPVEVKDTLYVPAQNSSLFKRDLASPGNAGDRLRVTAGTAGALDLFVMGNERLALDHDPDTGS